MDKRYQVFVSSTFADLKDERESIMRTLMEMDCIPAGMELFPAADEEQMAFIRRIIDDCDYYLLLIGGRYGSISPEGISFTEQEYDYAVKKGIKVVALLHQSPADIPLGKSEQDPILRERLNSFRAKAATGRMVRFWSSVHELPGLVSLSVTKTIKTYPAIGWVRGNSLASQEILQRMESLRQENEALREQIASSTPTVTVPSNIARIEDKVSLQGTVYRDRATRIWRARLTWKQIFWHISPYLAKNPSDEMVKINFVESIKKEQEIEGSSFTLDDQVFQTISIQLQVLGLIKVEYLQSVAGTTHLQWSLTPTGRQFMIEIRMIPRANTSSDEV